MRTFTKQLFRSAFEQKFDKNPHLVLDESSSSDGIKAKIDNRKESDNFEVLNGNMKQWGRKHPEI